MPPKSSSASLLSQVEPKSEATQTVLLAVSGLSPAVLTETIWALAHDPSTPVIPDKIIVLTTLTGERKIKEQLFGSDELWLNMRKQILGNTHESDPRLDFSDTSDRLKVFTRQHRGKRVQLDRIDSKEETEAVGDCLVEEIWNWVGRPNTRLLASISGGFKTMSALLYASMTVLAKPEDRILHVLVSDPFDGGTQPLFFWPEQPVQDLLTTRSSPLGPADSPVKASHAKLRLTDVEFPALRQLFGDYGLTHAPSFSQLVSLSRHAVADLADPPPSSAPKVELNVEKSTLSVEGCEIELKGRAFLVCAFLYERALNGEPHLSNKYDPQAEKSIQAFNAKFRKHYPSHPSHKHFPKGITVDEIPKGLSVLRTELKNHALTPYIPALAPLRARLGFHIHR